jgi:hypothetical protein
MQENSSQASRVLLDFVYALAIPIAGAIGAIVSWFVNRKRSYGEIANLEASAVKTRAEARRLDGETVNLAWDVIDELTKVNFELRRELDLSEIRGRHNEQQQRKMKALLDLHGIKYSEGDERN